MDQVSPNAPGFFKPEDRGDLAARPDITVGDTFYVSDETLESLMFGFGVASAVGAATFGIGTTVATIMNRRRLVENLDNAETWGSVKQEVARKEDGIQKELQKSDSEFFSEKLSAKKQSNRLNQVSRILLANVLLVRVSSMGKYGVQLIGRISWVATGALVFITSVVEAITNYKARQERWASVKMPPSSRCSPRLTSTRMKPSSKRSVSRQRWNPCRRR